MILMDINLSWGLSQAEPDSFIRLGAYSCLNMSSIFFQINLYHPSLMVIIKNEMHVFGIIISCGQNNLPTSLPTAEIILSMVYLE